MQPLTSPLSFIDQAYNATRKRLCVGHDEIAKHLVQQLFDRQQTSDGYYTATMRSPSTSPPVRINAHMMDDTVRILAGDLPQHALIQPSEFARYLQRKQHGNNEPPLTNMTTSLSPHVECYGLLDLETGTCTKGITMGGSGAKPNNSRCTTSQPLGHHPH